MPPSRTTSPQFSRELSLLVLCLRQTPNSAQTETLRQHLWPPLDWTEVTALAERHRLVPHLFLALKNSVADKVPSHAWERIRQLHRANASRNVQLMTELVRVIRRLDEAGIPALPIKGPALAIQLYGGLECRQFKDLDLTVPREHAVRAAEILCEMGYTTPHSLLPKLAPRKQQRFLARHKDIAFHKVGGATRVNLELHWHLAFGLKIPTATEFNTTELIVANHGTMRALSKPELTLFLSHHGACHKFFRLSWLADLLRAFESLSPVEWEALARQSLDFRCQRHFVLGLTVLSRLHLLTEPLPETIRNLADTTRDLDRLTERVFQAIANSRTRSQHPLQVCRWMFRLGGWRHGIEILSALIAPQPEDEMGRGLVRALWHRWHRVFAKYATH